MNFYVEDSINVRRNQVTIIGGGGAVYNAVLSIEKSNQGDDAVTLSEVKEWLYIDNNDFDNLLNILIPAAREICEDYANVTFTNQDLSVTYIDSLGNFRLPYGPVIGTVVYTDNDDNKTAVYTVGYEVNKFPAKLKVAWLNQIFFLFENRDKIEGTSSLSPVSKSILKPIRIVP